MKYIIEFEDMPSFVEDGIAYYQCRQVPWWYVCDSHIGRLTSAQEILSEIDKINPKVDEAYQRGFEDGKKEAESSEAIEQAKANAFNKGMLFKEEKIHDAYKRGFEDGKWKSEDGCTGCKYEGKTGEHLPCDYCMNSFKNQWTAKQTDDKIMAGDEVKAEDGTVVFFVTWMSDRCICGVDKEGKCYSYEPKEICGKTGRHFDIILEEKKA